ncbi:MAG: hypothetical protein P8K80_08350 [Phycisphaerales bacterium]|nr:hypothetical protein [Phycisphaerales bacterium]
MDDQTKTDKAPEAQSGTEAGSGGCLGSIMMLVLLVGILYVTGWGFTWNNAEWAVSNPTGVGVVFSGKWYGFYFFDRFFDSAVVSLIGVGIVFIVLAGMWFRSPSANEPDEAAKSEG